MTERQMADLVRHQKPLTMLPTDTVQAACRRMAERQVGAVLVTDANLRLLGIFTGRDAVTRVVADGRDPAKTKLADVMTRNPTSTSSNCTSIQCLRLMQDCGFRHVPIVDKEVLVGVVSRGDFRGREQDRLDEETGLWERLA